LNKLRQSLPLNYSGIFSSKLPLVCTLFSRQPHKVFTLLSRRGATEHSSTRPRFPTHHLLNVSKRISTDCK
jgi:hypothetical protein